MPIYEFKCTDCGNKDEVLLSFSDPEPAHCSLCQGPTQKIISQTSFSLKGSGWYASDYGRNNSSTNAKDDSAKDDSAKDDSANPVSTKASTDEATTTKPSGTPGTTTTPSAPASNSTTTVASANC